MTATTEMQGHYDVVYSPDDGGWYAELWWSDEQSPVYTSESNAQQWAINRGGKIDHSKDSR